MTATASSTPTFPVLTFSQGMVFPALSDDQLATCSKPALTNGYYKNLEVIDAEGKRRVVRGARKLHGVGPLWGYNIFLNQRIRVELEWEESVTALPLAEVIAKTLRVLDGPQEWDSRADFDELRRAVEKAASVGEIARLLSDS